MKIRITKAIQKLALPIKGVTEKKLRKIIQPLANKYPTKGQYWIPGYEGDYGLYFCRECALKMVESLNKKKSDDYYIDGGWERFEQDNQEFCQTCNAPLDNVLTEYGAQQELEHFQMYWFSMAPEDCYSLSNVIDSVGWEFTEEPTRTKYENKVAKSNNEMLHRLAFAILTRTAKEKERNSR